MDMRIGLFLIDSKSLFQGQQKDAAAKVARQLGVPLDVTFAEGDAARQREQIFAYIRKDPAPAGVIVEPVQDAGMRFVAQEAMQRGVAWVLINRHTPWVADVAAQVRGVAFCVTADQEGIGRMQGEQMRALLPGRATVLYVTGPMQSSTSQLRLQGTESAAGAAIALIQLHGTWTEQSGHDVVSAWLDTTRGLTAFDLICAQNDDMAVGARRALQHLAGQKGFAAFKDVRAIGVDGMPEYGLRLVDQQELTATVIKLPTTGIALEQLHGWLRSQVPPPPLTVVPAKSYPELERLRP